MVLLPQLMHEPVVIMRLRFTQLRKLTQYVVASIRNRSKYRKQTYVQATLNEIMVFSKPTKIIGRFIGCGSRCPPVCVVAGKFCRIERR